MITLQEFIKKYQGKYSGYPEGKYVGECLSIVKLYIKECFGIDPPPSGTNSAYGYWSNFPNPLPTVFSKMENTPDLIPKSGWIAIWKPWNTNEFGHIAIVDEGCTSTKLYNWAQNWTSRMFQKETNNYNNVVGFLVPKVTSSEPDMTDEQRRILEFLNGKTEGDVRAAFGALGDMPKINKEIEALKNSLKDMTSRVEQLEADAKANNELILGYQSSIQSAKSRESKLQADLKTMSDEKNVWKNRYESKLQETIDKLPLSAIIAELKRRLFISLGKK